MAKKPMTPAAKKAAAAMEAKANMGNGSVPPWVKPGAPAKKADKGKK